MTNRSTRTLITATCMLSAVLITMSALIANNLRDDALHDAQTNLNRHSLTLAGQAERSFQSIDLILSNISDHLTNQGAFDSASYRVAMGGEETFKFLQGKLAGLPQLEAITMIDGEGKLINFSRYWPIPDVNVADRDYFQALSGNSGQMTFIGSPVQNRGTGTWNIYVARRVNGLNGHFSGLILSAISLRYFEDFYKSISLGEGSAQSLLRDDGILLVQYPASQQIGKVLSNEMRPEPRSSRGIRRQGSVDQQPRVRATEKLANAPLVILTSRTERSVLESWRKTVRLLFVFTGGMIILLILSTVVIARHWKQQALFTKAKAEKADTERAMAQVETEFLREQERTAEAANRAKSSFLAVMSHEIRTPMNAVIGLTSTLLDTSLSREQRASVEAIHVAGDNLLEIINDILDFSRLEAGGMPIEEIPFEAEPLIASAIAIIGPSAAAKGLNVDVDIARDLPATLFGDPGRIRQVLLNLLSNSVKFTSQGRVTLKVECVTRDGEAATIRWSVSDTGIGIPADRVGALFNDFVQVDSSVNRRFGGSGLGLAICRRIADQMGGSIAVTSQLGQGSKFELQLNLPASNEPLCDFDDDESSSAVVEDLIRKMGRPLRVLVVDDNEMNRVVAIQMMRGFDVAITEASDGLQAMHAVANAEFDIIFMDMSMPEMDGLTTTSAIRACGGLLQTVPIVAFTANAFSDDKQACLRAGMSDFIAKPVRKKRLLRAVRRALSFDEVTGSEQRDTIELKDAPSIAAVEDPLLIESFDPGRFEMLSREITFESADQIHGMFVKETRNKIRSLVSGSEAMSRFKVENDAHSLKSAAGTFGYNELAHLAACLEREARDMGVEQFRAAGNLLHATFESENAKFERRYRAETQVLGPSASLIDA